MTEQQFVKKWESAIILFLAVEVIFVSALFIWDSQSNLKPQIDSLKTEKSLLKSQIDTLTSNYNAIEKDYDILEQDYNTIERDYETLESKQAFQDSNISQLINDKEALSTKINSLEADISQLTTDYDSLNSITTELRTQCEVLLSENEKLEGMVDYEIYDLPGTEYYHSVINDLSKANKTIFVAMYSMIYDSDQPMDWANNLLLELVTAKQRGVNVSVFIEYRTFFDIMFSNEDAFDYLQENGINVILDEQDSTDHMKLVIIDDEITYIGSHNWSESSLYYNTETSVKIVNQNFAYTLREYVSEKTGF